MTGVLPVSGVGARISGSTPVGGHNTPSDSASLSPRGLFARPTVESSGEVLPCCDPQPAEGDGGGGAVRCGGVAGVGGACAIAVTGAMLSRQTINGESFNRIQIKRNSDAVVPA